MYKEGKRRAHELLPSHLTPCVICFYSIAHHVLPVFVLFCNYILLPLMRFQDVQQGYCQCFSYSYGNIVSSAVLPPLRTVCSSFLNKKYNCKYNNYYFHLYFHEAWGSTRVPLHTMSVFATNCRRLCQCFLQKHCFGCSGLVCISPTKILVSIQQFRGGQCFPYVKH